jgi:hypothetical protein
VDFRVKGVAHAAFVSAAAEHAGHGRNAQLLDVSPRIDVRVDVHHHAVCLAIDVEAVRARCAGRVQQRVDHKPCGVFGWLLEPELCEVRKFFRAVGVGVDRQTPGGKTVLLIAIDGAEVAGAQKRQDVVDRDLGGFEQFETRKAQVALELTLVDATGFVVEQLGAEMHFTRLLGCRVDAVHAHRSLEARADVEEMHVQLAFHVIPQ